MNIARNIRRVRLAAELTQTELAVKCKVDRSYIWHLEADDRKPSLRVLGLIAKACGVKVKVKLE